jgi:hypothetical protein
MMNQEKIKRAAAATDVILGGRAAALQCLQAPMIYNAAGVLSDPSMVRSNLHRAKAAIDMALDAMNSLAPEAASPRRKGAARKRPHVQQQECFVTSSVSSIAVAAPLR